MVNKARLNFLPNKVYSGLIVAPVKGDILPEAPGNIRQHPEGIAVDRREQGSGRFRLLFRKGWVSMFKGKPEMLVCLLLAVVLILAACSVSIERDDGGEAVNPDSGMDEPIVSGDSEDKNEPVSSDDPVEPAPTFSEEERARFKEAVYLEDIQLLTLESFPLQMHAVLTGNLPDGCTRIAEIAVEKPSDNVFEIHVFTLRPEGLACTQALVPFEESVALDVYGLPAGEYTVKAYDLAEEFTLASDNSIE